MAMGGSITQRGGLLQTSAKEDVPEAGRPSNGNIQQDSSSRNTQTSVAMASACSHTETKSSEDFAVSAPPPPPPPPVESASSSSVSGWEDRGHHSVSSSTKSLMVAVFDDSSNSNLNTSCSTLQELLIEQNEDLANSLVLEAAKQAVLRLSCIFPHDKDALELPRNFPKFGRNEIKLGKCLGEGSFSTVHAIQRIDNHCSDNKSLSTSFASSSLPPQHTTEDDNHGHGCAASARAFVSSRCLSNLGEARYCLKELKPKYKKFQKDLCQRSGSNSTSDQQPQHLNNECDDNNLTIDCSHTEAWAAMVDLVSETKILSQIVHPYIIKLRAVATGNPFGDEYFLVLDHLWERLDQRMHKWKMRQAQRQRQQGWRFWRRRGQHAWQQEQCQQEKRLQHAQNLAQALVYLHQNRLIHRDIKPENIGFDLRDDIKLFDFGFARQLPRSEDHDMDDDCYHMSSMTGTLRYMAPEIALGQRYNDKCDVYSFTVLLWEMLSCQRPYNHYANVEKLTEDVFHNGERPPVPRYWNKPLQQVLESGWSSCVAERSTMRQMCRGLMAQIKGDPAKSTKTRKRSPSPSDEKDTFDATPITLAPARRRSTVVFRLSPQTQTLLRLPAVGDGKPLTERDLEQLLEAYEE